MVEVFKTNVAEEVEAKFLLNLLNIDFPCYKINFESGRGKYCIG